MDTIVSDTKKSFLQDRMENFQFYNKDIAEEITAEGRKQLLTSSAMIACYNLEADWCEENVKDAISAIIDMLKAADDELGDAKHTHIHNRDILKVSFTDHGFAKCAPWEGTIEFGPRIFFNDLSPESFGYATEKPYIQKRYKTRIHGLIWLVLHEYCHLFKGRLQHRKSFYEFIDSKFEKFFNHF